MAGSRAIDLALDLARMPAFAPSMSASPLPADVLEVIRIAAESPEDCRAAALTTGAPESVLIEAARFYLQQVLFRDEADCYRILGIRPGEPREAARDHMRWLLRWLHPDRNGGWDAVYAKRIVNAWREISSGSQATAKSAQRTVAKRQGRLRTGVGGRTKRSSGSLRIPWIARPYEDLSIQRHPPIAAFLIKIVIGLSAAFLLFGLTMSASTFRAINDLW